MRRLRTDQRGAVLAEFVVAIVPMLITFFSFTQVARAYTAGLVMRHATVVAARYAMVSYGSCLPEVGGGGATSDQKDAAIAALGPYAKVVSVESLDPSYAGGDPYGDVTVTATYAYQCDVPLGGRIVCPGGTLRKTIKVVMPHSGARYKHACAGGSW